ncbi:unnamed protein product [Effrenium voratum]|uniref:Uncharacterized protein n=1 Tax=Effrenium voratum TaxID=2562239 RepID=A0AA36HRW0_9DINO|nr:unnamed protein product [Effrenium voratum]
MSSFAAAAAVAAGKHSRENLEKQSTFGELPKMPWIYVCDQRQPVQPRRLPVPKYFQCGNEHAGKLTWESVAKWLSRGVERQVTAIWIASEQAGKNEWKVQELPMQLMSSPFKDGTLVVVCCAEETLTPNIFAQLPAPSKLHRQMSKEAVALGGKMWKSARSRVGVIMAFRPPPLFGNFSSLSDSHRSATPTDDSSNSILETHAVICPVVLDAATLGQYIRT